MSARCFNICFWTFVCSSPPPIEDWIRLAKSPAPITSDLRLGSPASMDLTTSSCTCWPSFSAITPAARAASPRFIPAFWSSLTRASCAACSAASAVMPPSRPRMIMSRVMAPPPGRRLSAWARDSRRAFAAAVSWASWTALRFCSTLSAASFWRSRTAAARSMPLASERSWMAFSAALPRASNTSRAMSLASCSVAPVAMSADTTSPWTASPAMALAPTGPLNRASA